MSDGLPGAFPHLWDLPCATPHRVQGSLLFADISGFTALSERLARKGTQGTETLTHLLNRYFQTMLDLTARMGGEILGFSGDALLVGFYGPPEHTHPWACHCAANLLEAMTPFHAYPTPWGPASVDMKTVVASGTWGETLLGDDRRRVLFLYGALLETLTGAEDQAQRGELWVQGIRVPPHRHLDPPAGAPPFPPSREPLPDHHLMCFLPQGVDRFLDRALQGEHRPATAVFVHVGGYHPENPPLKALQSFTLHILDLMERHRGSLNKSDISGKGWKLLITFGAPQATEDAPLQALRAALALQQAVSRLTLRIGIATGFVYAGIVGTPRAREYTVIGDPVNTAARLAAEAPPGDILMDLTTRRLTLPQIESRLFGSLHLQGKAEPLRCYQPVTASSPDVPTLPLVGRDAEQKAVLEALSLPGVVYIRGPAGIGKTRLLRSVLDLVPRTHRTLRATVEEQGDAYQVFRDLVDSLAGVRIHTGEAAQRQALETHVQELPDPTGSLQRRLPFLGAMLFHLSYPDSLYERVGPKLRKTNLLEGLRAYFSALAHQGPVLIVVDNAQWLRPTSLEFLQRLMEDLLHPTDGDPLPLTFVLASRETSDTLQPLEVPPGMLRLDLILPPLTPEEVHRLTEVTLHTSLTPDQAHALHRMTQGVPLYLEQLLLQIQAGDRTLNEVLASRGSLSESVWQTIMARVDRLPPQTQQGLRIGSVMGTTFLADVVAHMMNAHAPDLLHPAVQHGLVERMAASRLTYAFRNPTVREVIYRSMLQRDLRTLHLQVAEAYEHLFPEDRARLSDLLAHHYRKAEAWDRAFRYLRESAEQHVQRGQLQEALDMLHDALFVQTTYGVGSDEDAFRLHLRCAHVADMLGDRTAVEHHYREAETLAGASPSRLARVYRERAHTLQLQGASKQALQEILHAHSLLQRIPPPLPIFLKAEILGTRCWIHGMRGEYPEAIEAGEAALKALDEDRVHLSEDQLSDWMGRRAMLLNFLGHAYTWVHNFSRAETLYQEALELADIAGFPELLASIEGNLALLEQKQGKFDRAIARTRRQLAYFEQLGVFREQARVSNNLGLLLLDRGQDVDEVERLFTQSLEISRRHGFSLIHAQSISCLGMLALARGAFARARAYFEEAEQRFRELHLPYYVLVNRLNLAVCWMEEGNLGTAQTRLEALYPDMDPFNDTGLAIELRMYHTLLLLRIGEETEARRLFKEIRSRLRDHPEQYPAYVVPFLEGMVAAAGSRWTAARAHLQKALGLIDENEDLRVRGMLLLELAGVCRHLKDPAAALYLEEAEAIYATFRHQPNLRRIQKLRSSG